MITLFDLLWLWTQCTPPPPPSPPTLVQNCAALCLQFILYGPMCCKTAYLPTSWVRGVFFLMRCSLFLMIRANPLLPFLFDYLLLERKREKKCKCPSFGNWSCTLVNAHHVLVIWHPALVIEPNPSFIFVNMLHSEICMFVAGIKGL